MTKQADMPASYAPDWIERLDGRSTLARVVTERLTALEADLGGRDFLSYQRRSLIKRAVFMEAVIERTEAALARGEEVDHGKLTQAVNSLIGLYKTLGLERVARDVPTLHQYIREKQQAAQQ
jgi:hypothetical protein